MFAKWKRNCTQISVRTSTALHTHTYTREALVSSLRRAFEDECKTIN